MPMILSAADRLVMLDRYRADLRADGYAEATFSGWSEIDAEVCAKATCSVCGRCGLWYEPWRATQGRGYRALAICPDCSHWEEF